MTKNIYRALQLAKDIHNWQTYWDNKDFVTEHLFEVARRSLDEYRCSTFYDPVGEEFVVICALLHDAIEDGPPWVYEYVYEIFGVQCARVLWLLASKYMDESWNVVKKEKISYYHSLWLDKIATLIKKQDRKLNHENILNIPSSKRRVDLTVKYLHANLERAWFDSSIELLVLDIKNILKEVLFMKSSPSTIIL
jgi:(p)ppGpp synthase/HD superfamily hydrolase